MVKKIMRDPLFLAQKSVNATETDKQVVVDLLDIKRLKQIIWIRILGNNTGDILEKWHRSFNMKQITVMEQ